MTILYEPPPHRAWRVNRVTTALAQVATECADPRLTRVAAQQLADRLRELAQVVADLYICPVCRHPDACTCADCPVGVLTAQESVVTISR